jgi:hypothetical protein
MRGGLPLALVVAGCAPAPRPLPPDFEEPCATDADCGEDLRCLAPSGPPAAARCSIACTDSTGCSEDLTGEPCGETCFGGVCEGGSECA